MGVAGEFRVEFHAEIEGFQLGHGHVLDMAGAGGGTADVIVVADGVLLVGGQMDVGFEAVGVHIQRELEGGQGVFRRVCTRAAVGLNLNHAMTPFLHKICLIIQPGRGG